MNNPKLNFEQLTIPEYFWQRKRNEAIKIIVRNIEKIFPESVQQYKIADIGSGAGVDTFLLFDYLKTKRGNKINLTGLDGNEQAVLTGNKRVKDKHHHDRIKFILQDITARLPFEDNELDFVYCSEVVEHMISPEAILQEFKRILKKGGHLFLTTMNQPNVFEFAYWRNLFSRTIKPASKELDIFETCMVNNKPVNIYGHISVRPIPAWDNSLKATGFDLADFGRGAIRYALPASLDKNSFMEKMLFSSEAFLDIFPRQWTRGLSSQLIGLYKSR